MSEVFGKGGGGHGGGHGGHHGGGLGPFWGGGYLVDYVPYYIDEDDEEDGERHLVIGLGVVTDFTNERMYLKGAVVKYLGGYWKANRTVDIPMFPFIMAGEVPGVSDAWDSIAAPTNIKGDATDSFDIAAETQKMNALKQVPVSVAQVLLRNGQDAINHAITVAKSKNLPNQNTLNVNFYKLQWHQTELAKYAATPFAIYPSADDLKKWVMEAFINANATDVGAEWVSNGLSKMWAEIRTAIAALPAQARAAVSAAVEGITGVPLWAWGVGGVAVVGLLGFAVYKIAMGPTGQTAAKVYFGRGR